MLHRAVLAAEVIHVEYKRAQNTVHDDIGDNDIFYDAAPLTARLDAYAAVCLIEYAVGDSDIAYAAAHLGTDNNTAMAMQHGTAGNRDIFARMLVRSIFRTGFDNDTVIADINGAVQNAKIPGAVRIDTVRVGRIGRILDRDAADQHIIAV